MSDIDFGLKPTNTPAQHLHIHLHQTMVIVTEASPRPPRKRDIVAIIGAVASVAQLLVAIVEAIAGH